MISRWARSASRCSTMRADQAVGIPDHPPVAGRVGHHGRQHRCRRAALPVFGEQRSQGLRGQHRRVGQGDDHLPGQLGELPERGLHGVPGAQLLLLHGGDDVWGDVGQMLLDLLAPVPDDHDDMFRLDLGGRAHRVTEHGMPGELVQQLGPGGLHPLALAGGKDDDGSHRGRLGDGLVGQQRAPCRPDAPRVGVEPTSLVLIQSQAGPAGRPTGDHGPGPSFHPRPPASHRTVLRTRSCAISHHLGRRSRPQGTAHCPGVHAAACRQLRYRVPSSRVYPGQSHSMMLAPLNWRNARPGRILGPSF